MSTQLSSTDGSLRLREPTAGQLPDLGSAPPAGRFPTTATSSAVVLTAGSSVDTADFGLDVTPNETASIGDLVWDDANGDGVFDTGELGVPGVTITLRRDVDGDGIFETSLTSAVTDGDGAYRFANLAPGEYRTVVTVPAGRSSTTPVAIDVVLTAGETDDSADFGLATAPPPLGTVGDRVWLDTNGNGTQDPTEPGTNGVTVTLLSDLDGDGQYETAVATTTTSGDGNYVFNAVEPGAYRVVATPPAGFDVTTPAPVVTLAPGASIDDADIGLATTPPEPYDLAAHQASWSCWWQQRHHRVDLDRRQQRHHRDSRERPGRRRTPRRAVIRVGVRIGVDVQRRRAGGHLHPRRPIGQRDVERHRGDDTYHSHRRNEHHEHRHRVGRWRRDLRHQQQLVCELLGGRRASTDTHTAADPGLDVDTHLDTPAGCGPTVHGWETRVPWCSSPSVCS